MLRIARRRAADRQRPADGKLRVGGEKTAFRFGRVRRRTAIDDVRLVAQRLEAVRKTFRHEERQRIVGADALRMPLQESGRAGTDVDGDIPDFALKAVDELHFGERWTLEV